MVSSQTGQGAQVLCVSGTEGYDSQDVGTNEK